MDQVQWYGVIGTDPWGTPLADAVFWNGESWSEDVSQVHQWSPTTYATKDEALAWVNAQPAPQPINE